MKMGKTFEEIKVGDSASLTVETNANAHKEFEKLSGDDSPVHTDDAFARKSGFKKKIGYAFLLSSYLSRLYGTILPGGTSVCLRQEADFVSPWYPSDTLTFKAKVLRKITSTRIIEIHVEVKRNGGALVMRGLGTLKLLT